MAFDKDAAGCHELGAAAAHGGCKGCSPEVVHQDACGVAGLDGAVGPLADDHQAENADDPAVDQVHEQGQPLTGRLAAGQWARGCAVMRRPIGSPADAEMLQPSHQLPVNGVGSDQVCRRRGQVCRPESIARSCQPPSPQWHPTMPSNAASSPVAA